MNPISPAPTNRRIAGAALVVSLLLVIAVSWFSTRSTIDLANASGWVAHTLQVEREAERILSQVKDADAGQREFLITRNPSYLELFDDARSNLSLRFDRLKWLTRDNNQQAHSIEELRGLTSARLELAADTIARSQANPETSARDLVGTNQGPQMMAQIRAVGQRIIGEEERLLEARQQTMLTHTQRNRWIALGISSIHFLFLVALAILLWRLTNMQRYLTICAWSKTVEYEGAWITFEEYLKRRFHIDVSHGLSPAQAQRLRDETGQSRAA